MKVVIFFGHHKVGSTALQAFLSQNALALLRAGILYPAVEAEGQADLLKRALQGQDTPGAPPINVREPHNALAFRLITDVTGRDMPPFHQNLPGTAQMIRTIRKQVQALDPGAVILCSEVMSNLGPRDPGLIARIRDIFPDAEFELYCTFRRPDEYLVSWYGQRLTLGHKVAPLWDGGALDYTSTIHFDYRALLEPWRRCFAGAPFHVRNYRDVLAAGGSVEDFTGRVGIDFPSGLAAPERSNRSLPYALMEILRRANRTLPRPEAKRLRGFLLGLSDRIDLPANGEVEMFGAGVRADLFRAFAPIHDYLCDATGRPAFFPDLGEMRIVRPVPEPEASRAALAELARLKRGDRPGKPLWSFIRQLAAEAGV